MFNPSAKFNNINVTSKLNQICPDFPVPIVVYNLTDPIRNNIFHFNTFVSSINTNAILDNSKRLQMITTCDAMRNLVLFPQFTKREKHPWKSVTFSKVAD